MAIASGCFVPDAEHGWVTARVVEVRSDGRYLCELEDGSSREVDVRALEGGVLPLQNEYTGAAGCEDMTTLDHLHEASIVHNLRLRHSAAKPYTYTAVMLAATPPPSTTPHPPWSPATREQWEHNDRGESVPLAGSIQRGSPQRVLPIRLCGADGGERCAVLPLPRSSREGGSRCAHTQSRPPPLGTVRAVATSWSRMFLPRRRVRSRRS